MRVISILRQRRVGRAIGTLSITTSLLLGAASFPTTLQATSESPVAQTSELKVPADLTEEAIEAIDAELAQAAGPFLRTLFDPKQPADERQRAAAELRTLANNLSAATPEKDSLRRRLQRRVALMSSAIEASGAAGTGSSSTAPNLTSAAASTVQWLNSIAVVPHGLPICILKTSRSPTSASMSSIRFPEI
ncbi:MAG: hypothetical protein WKF77_14320 [Planctomycetaceae bacterium]